MSAQPAIDSVRHTADVPLRVASAIAIVIAAWGILALLVWNLDRGFDLTDEATLLYFYRHPNDFLDRLYLQHFRLVSALTPAGLDHIIYYRLVKLLALLGFTALFAALLVRWLGRRFGSVPAYLPRPIVLFHFLLLGAFLAYCHGSQTLSYNDLVTFSLLTVAAACVALDLAPARVNNLAWRLIVSVPIGVAIALLLPIKWTSAPPLAGCYLLFAALVSAERDVRSVAASLAGAIAGALLTLIVTSDVGLGTMFSLSKLFGVMGDRANLELHDPFALLGMYATGALHRFGALLQSPAVAVLVLPVAAAMVHAMSGNGAKRRVLRGALIIASLLALIAFLVRAPGWAWRHLEWFHRYNVADLQTFAFAFCWLGAGLLALRNLLPRPQATPLLVAALLLASLPVAGSVGTNNPLLTQSIRHMAPLFAALAIAAALLGLASRWRAFAPLVCAALAALTAAQIAFVVLLHPYRLQQPGFRQTVALAAPPHMAGLKVDPPTSAFIGRLLAEAKHAIGDTTRMPMLALFDMPGAIYILDGISIGYPWHSAASSEKIVCQRIRSDPRSHPTPRLILLDRDAVSAALYKCLREGGIDLARYREAAQIGNFAGDGRMLRLLVPRADSR